MPKSLLNSINAEFIERQLAAHFKYDFRSNAIVQIDDRRGVQINGRTLSGLKSQDFIVLRILARHALAFPGTPIAVEEIIDALGGGTRRLNTHGMSWGGPTDKAVHDSTYRIRRALEKAGQNSELIETISRKGYRLSTPAMNISLSVPAEDSGELRMQAPRSPRLRRREHVVGRKSK